MRGYLQVLLLIVASAAAFVGCGEEEPRCKGPDDCLLPEVCVVGRCERPEPVLEGEVCGHADHCVSGVCVVGPSEIAAPKADAGSGDVGIADAGDTDGGAVDAAVPDAGSVDSGSVDSGRALQDASTAQDAVTSADGALLPAGWGRCRTRCGKPSDCAQDRPCVPEVARTVEAPAEGLMMLCSARAGGDRYLGETCTDGAQCRDGMCEEGVCARACDGDCPTPMACGGDLIARGGHRVQQRVCQVGARLVYLELGAFDTPAEGSNEVHFELPAGVASAVIFAIDEDEQRVAIRKLVGPDGTTIVDSADPAAALQKSGPYIGSGTVVLPGDESVATPLAPGRYRLEVGTYDPKVFDKLSPVDGDVERVAVVYRPAHVQGGRMDLNIHLSPGTGLDAAKGPGSGYLKAVLARIQGLYRRNVGVTLGDIRYFNLPKTDDVVADGDAARELCKRAAQGGAGQAVNIMMVKDLGFTVGFAGGVGAPPGVYGLPGSCVVIEKQASANTMGVVAAHELGHFLGLWHTTEVKGGMDTLDDTPTCPADTNTKSCPDYRNMMFPIFPTNDPLTLSPTQRMIARGSPWLYEEVYPELCGPQGSVDLIATGFASGVTPEAGKHQGSCGGEQYGERAHFFRLAQSEGSLDIKVLARGFAPVVYIRFGDCSESAEVACAVGEPGKELVLSLPDPKAGAYHVLVDGQDGAGFYTLSANTTDKAAP